MSNCECPKPDDPIDLDSADADDDDTQAPCPTEKVKVGHIDLDPGHDGSGADSGDGPLVKIEGCGGGGGDINDKDDVTSVQNTDDCGGGDGGVDQNDFDDSDINPFLLNTVIKVMMSQMSIEDLKKCRSVSSVWDEAATAELHKLAPLLRSPKFWDSEKVDYFTKLMRNSPTTRQFTAHSISHINIEAISSNQLEFLQIFEPKVVELDFGEICMEELVEFLQKCGNFVKILKIHEGWLRRTDGEITWPENFIFPQLEELKVCIRDKKILPQSRITIEDNIHILENFIKSSPRLTRLHLVHRYGVQHQHLDFLRHSSGILENLQELTISVDAHQFRDDILTIPDKLIGMSKIGLRLRRFKMVFKVRGGYSSQEPEFIPPTPSFFLKLNQFISCQSKSLESLSIYIYLHNSDDDAFASFGKFKFPQMSKLKVVEIKNWCVKSFVAFDQMDLPSCFPQLTEMELKVERPTNTNFTWGTIFHGVSESVEKFIMRNYSVPKERENTDYRSLGEYFPNVKWFSVSCSYWQKNDTILTLLPWTTTLTNLTLHLFFGTQCPDFGILACLKVLKKLEILKQYGGTEWEGQCDEIEILNINLESLSKTSISYLKIKYFQITPTLESQLREKYILDYAPPLPFPPRNGD